MAEKSAHLAERVAALLRAEAGLAPADEAPPPLPPLPRHAVAEAVAELPPVPGLPQALPAADLVVTLAVLQRAGLVLSGARSRATEEYRISVERILRALRGSRAGRAGAGNLLMITSARPGEGKSFSALNLAASIAQNGLAEVLLVDVDGKPRSLTAQLGLNGRNGLLDLAAEPSLRPETVVVASEVDGLSVVPVGTVRAGVEGGVTRAVGAAVERLGRRLPHHVVILDTAPCLSTSDPSALAPLVNVTVMVVEAQRTQKSELQAALELVRACPNVALVLNKIQLTQRHAFGSYYYFREAT